MTDNKKIGLFMWYDDAVKTYASINYAINNIYCNKYNYKLIKSNVRLCPKRKPHWERIYLLLKYIDSFDYLIWIDADAHFYVDSPPIENVISENSDKLFIFSGDIGVKEKLTCQINSGFFIVKSTDKSKEILNMWGYDENLFNSPKQSMPIFGSNHWNDQAILRIMYDENILNIQSYSIIIEYGILQHFDYSHNLKEKIYGLTDKPFVFHLAGEKYNPEEHIRISNAYYTKVVKNKYQKFINKNIQLADNVITDILRNCQNKKMLVFGLGYDSELWYNATNKNTLFVENNQDYINLNKNIIDNDKIIYYNYPNINVKKSLTLNDEQINSYKMPTKLLDFAPYNIILVDGPNGFCDTVPGRLLPIFWSKKYLSKKGTIIYVDDASRKLEKTCINKYFKDNKKIYFKNRLGTMKIMA